MEQAVAVVFQGIFRRQILLGLSRGFPADCRVFTTLVDALSSWKGANFLVSAPFFSGSAQF